MTRKHRSAEEQKAATSREQRLAKALRDNLRRRKLGEPDMPLESPVEDSHG